MNTYSGLIKCLNCGKKYKVKKERGKVKYICSSYDRYGKEVCERNIVSESELNEFVNLHFRKELSDKEIKKEVKTIELNKEEIHIGYFDGTSTIKTNTYFQI